MLETTMFDAQSTGREASPRIYSPSVEPLMQSLMATLANIDCEHELEVAKLGRSIAPVSVKARVLAGLNQRHEERRGALYSHPLHRSRRSADFAHIAGAPLEAKRVTIWPRRESRHSRSY